MPTSEVAMPNEKVCLRNLSKVSMAAYACGGVEIVSYIRTHTVLLMPPGTNPFRATGRQKIIITSMAGQ